MKYYVIVKNPDEYGNGCFVHSNLRGFSSHTLMFEYSQRGKELAFGAKTRILQHNPNNVYEVRGFDFTAGRLTTKGEIK